MLNTRIKISLVLSSLLFGGLLLACNASEENELPTEEPLVEQTETPQDTDGDGVIDTLDTCPNTPTNVQVDSNGCAVNITSPQGIAPQPTHAEEEVIALFSDHYSIRTVDTYLTPWSQATQEVITLSSNELLHYQNVEYAAIETTSEPINATAKTHVHFDYWTSNATLIKFKLVDFGANGVYNGVGVEDDTEHEITIDNLSQRQWVSVDLALDDFETLGARANLAQYIITLEPYGTADIFIDNLYFYGDNGQSTDAQDNNGNNDASNGNDADSATDYDNLVLVWSDEFDYSGRPDTSKWYHQTFAPNGGSWFNGELQHYVDNEQTTYVDSGSLKIVARKQNYTTQGSTKNYTSARLNSKGSFQYGRVDVRAKLPQGGGTWPAIWTLGTNINEAGNYYGNQYGSVGWPACGEIDIMEQNGWDKNQTYGYFHWGDTQTGAYVNQGTTTYINNSGAYHLYSLIWTEQVMQILLDNEVFIELPNDANNPYDNPHYLLMNIAVGGNLGGNVPTNFGTQIMEVDYVRIYRFATAD